MASAGRRLPAGDLDRIVPRADADADAERLAPRIGEGAAEIDVLAVEGGDARRRRIRGSRRGGGVGDQRFLDRLAGVERLEPRKLVVAGAQDVGGAAQDAAALDRLQPRPGGLGLARGLDRKLDDIGGRRMQLRDDLAGRRIDDGDRGTALVIDEAAVDIVRSFGLGAHSFAPIGYFVAGRDRRRMMRYLSDDLPARIDPRFLVGRGERRAAEDVVGGLFAGHDRRRVEIAVGDAREDRGIGDAQAVDADDAAFRIDHAHRVVGAAHAAGAARVIGAFGMLADEGVELVVASATCLPGRDLPAAKGVEGRLARRSRGSAGCSGGSPPSRPDGDM